MGLIKFIKYKLEGKETRDITISNIENYLFAKINKLSSKISSENWKEEQALYRKLLIEINSPKCIKLGDCIKCGCEISDMVYEKKKCSGNCYNEWMNEDEWKKYKEGNEYKVNLLKTIMYK